MLLKAENANVTRPVGGEITPATPEQMKDALTAVLADVTATGTENTITVDKAGVYAIKAVAKQDSQTTYAPMSAYVGFDYTQPNAPILVNTTVYAKKSTIPVVKNAADADGDGVTEIGEEVTYTIKTAVPYLADRWTLTDTLTGGEYVTNTEGKVVVTATIPGKKPVELAATVEKADKPADYKFTIDLSSLQKDSKDYGKEVTLTYKAKVTATEIKNVASSLGHNSETVTTGTGQITLTKTDAKDTNIKLAGAGFKVTKASDDKKTPLTFKADKEGVAGAYTYDPKGTITEVFTGEGGTLVIKGLDADTYNFKETTAPEGYHIANSANGIDVAITIAKEQDLNKDTVIVEAAGSLTNTKLAHLPATGGIGTTLFTIGGIAIMVIAAALYFANRKKSEK